MKDINGIAIGDFDDFSFIGLGVGYIRASNIEECESADKY